MQRELFGEIGKESVYKYSIFDGNICASILSYGAKLQSLKVGETQVVIGFDDIQSYVEDTNHFGGVIGRLCNRTKGGLLQIRDKTYQLETNKNGCHIHGGSSCFDNRLWHLVFMDETHVVLGLDCPAGESNYPGNLKVEVTYSIINNSLIFSYKVQSDASTKVNITNHSYFNLKGNSDVLTHKIIINSDEIVLRDENYLFTSKRKAFCQEKPCLLEEVKKSACYLLRNKEACKVQFGSIVMEVSTSLPAMLLYCADSLKEIENSNTKRSFRYCGFCPETHFVPNNVPILEKGEILQEWTKYKFNCI
ncbi:MAG: hypothetical protein PHD05_06095 [Sphaerochaetaceae bacterium]|nr:hypothetical protein [Sphaerochaetaceae bacterium]